MKTLLIDGDWLVKKKHFSNYSMKTSSQNLKCGAIVGFMNLLRNLLIEIKPVKVVVCWSGFKEGYEKYSSLPIIRKEKEDFFEKKMSLIVDGDFAVDNKSDLDFLEIIRQTFKIKKLLEEMSIRQIEVDYYESVDLISEYCIQACETDEIVYIMGRKYDFDEFVSMDINIVEDGFKVINKKNFNSIRGYHFDNSLLINCLSLLKGVSRIGLVKKFPILLEEKYTYIQICNYICGIKNYNKIKFYKNILSSSSYLKEFSITQKKVNNYSRSVKNEVYNVLFRSISSDRNIEIVKEYYRVDGYEKFIDIDVEKYFLPFYIIQNNEIMFNQEI
jgi:5'-3' exonuclease